MPETVLALCGAAVGVASAISAFVPLQAWRFDVVRGVLPADLLHVAASVSIVFGIALVWLAQGLARRKRRAWQLAVAVAAGMAVSHLVKGLAVEEAAVSVALLAALLAFRGRFRCAGDPAVWRPLAQVVAALGTLAAVAVLDVSGVVDLPERAEEACGLLGAVLVARALALWLRPPAQDEECPLLRARAREVVAAHGCDTLAFFALRADKRYVFSPSGATLLAYRVVNGVALVSGDPIGRRDEMRGLLEEFRRIAQLRGWRLAVLAASAELLPLYEQLGLKPVYLGDEAVVVPERFSLEGRPIRKVRQSVARLEREAYRLRVLPVAEVDERLADELRAVSSAWRGRRPERGFTMAMDGLFAYPEALLAVAEHEDGTVGGFLQLVPVPATGGYSLASMRRRRNVPNGLMEFLLARTIAWACEHAVPELSLNFSVFGETIREPASARHAALRFGLLRLDRLFQIDRLLRFNRKFFPEWRPRYICLERTRDLPLVGLAFLRAESLLVPPGPWARSRDFAAR